MTLLKLSSAMVKFLADVIAAGVGGFAGVTARPQTYRAVIKRGFVYRTPQQLFYPTAAGLEAHRKLIGEHVTRTLRYPEERKSPTDEKPTRTTRETRVRKKCEVSFEDDTYVILEKLCRGRPRSHVLEDLVRAEGARLGLVGESPT